MKVSTRELGLLMVEEVGCVCETTDQHVHLQQTRCVQPSTPGPGVRLVLQSMEDTFTLFLATMVVTQSSICLLPLVSKVFTERVGVESGSVCLV